MADPFPRPPINQWQNLREFRQFLQGLWNLDIANLLPRWTPLTNVRGINFHFPGGTIQAAFENWFFHYYNLRGQQFAVDIWQVLEQSDPDSTVLLDAIRSINLIS